MKLAATTQILAALTVWTSICVLATTALQANEIGWGFSAGGDVTTEYAMDAENLSITLNPELSYDIQNVTLSASTELDLWTTDDKWALTDSLDNTVLDFEVSSMVMDNLEAYIETSWDLDDEERGEITIGTKYTF